MILGLYLMRRRRRAWGLAVVVLVAAGALNLLKGLDIEEAMATWALGGSPLLGPGRLLRGARGDGWSRPCRRSGGDRRGARRERRRSSRQPIGALRAHPGRGIGELEAALTLSPRPIHYRDPFEWIPAASACSGRRALTVGWLFPAARVAPRIADRATAAARPGDGRVATAATR